MKSRIFSLVTVVMLIVMTLPAASPPVAAQPIGWPTTWEPLTTDANERGCDTFRNVADMDGDGYATYYYVDSEYIYLRMETVSSPGWPDIDPSGDARYKWWFNTAGTAAYVKGTTVYDAEFLLILEDLTDNSNDPYELRDMLGELTLMDDFYNDGFMKRWDSTDPPNYVINDAQTPPTGPSPWWRRELGTGTPGTGGPQGVMGADIGYRIDNTTTGGNFVDIYISRAVLDNPSSLCLVWATDNQDPNLDQAPNCDRPVEETCIMLGKDFGDAPDPTYPTLLVSDGARHDVGDLYLGADIDAELDGQPNATATGDDDSNINDEDGVVFTTALVKGQLAGVTVTASAAGYLDAWLDFDGDGDWADAGEQIFDSHLLSAGANILNFPVPFSATAGQTFARFRFSSAGNLSYVGLAADGEVEDYQVAIEGCTLTVSLTGDTSFCEGSSTTITADVTDGASPYIYDWTASTAPGSANNGSYNATGSGTVAVTVTDYYGCTGSASVTVTANQRPTADFFSNVTDCCEPLTVQFTDNSTAGDSAIVSWYWEFGDGDTSTLEDPSHAYADGTYTVSLTVTDSYGCSDTKTRTEYITSNEGPTADFSANVTYCCDPLTVQFTDLSTAGDNTIVSWYWKFGDGDNSTDPNPSHTYADGTYTVSLTVTDSHGCKDTVTKDEYITSNEGPTADFFSDVTDCCNPLTVQFTDNSTAGSNLIVSWYWDFGDGSNSTDENPSHTYDAGTYNVTLTVTDEHGCSDSETKENYITSNQGPTADFSSNVTDCCEPLTVQFTDLSTAGDNPIVSWYWEFGDGTNSTDPNPSHTYDAGTYTVTLRVTDSHGCIDTETKENYITANKGPTADFSADVTSCCKPLTVKFTDLSTAGDNAIISWYWEFGDGDTSSDWNPSHTYDTSGTYNVTLTVIDEHGCRDSETKENYITANEGPTADFSSNVTDCCKPLTVQFTDNSTAGSNAIVSWEWDFGDGGISIAKNPSHTYDTPGTYNVTLTVIDKHGCRDSETKENYITVNEGPTADFSANVTDCCEPLTVKFTDLSTEGDNTIVSWEWDFGDGDNSTDRNPSHTYDAGTYTVSLTVTDSHGCKDTVTKDEYITSNEGPTADFFSDVTDCCNPLTVHFSDNSTFGSNPTVSWEWDFGDGGTSNDHKPSHTYDTPGTYNVTMTVTDSHGCSDTVTKENYITSNQGPTADFSSNVTDCCKPLTVQFYDNSTAGSNPIVSWEWSFGDGDTSTAQNASHTYDTAGTYTVILAVTDSHGCKDKETKKAYITSNEGPAADFSSNVTDCCEPLTVKFTDLSTAGDNPIVSWSWDFGDGDTSTAQNASHTYDAGTYNVTLTVTDEHGCSDSKTKEEYITSNEGPTADFSSNVTSCCEPLTVQFTDNSTAGSNRIKFWSWDFGDGAGSMIENPSHTYDTPGTYNVTLTVTDEHGCSDSETKTEYITVNEVPTADFSSNVTDCCKPLTVQFYDNSTAGSNPIVSWRWSFGDGDTSTAQNASHTYNASGTYTVTLTVTDSHGCKDTKTKDHYITSNEGPTADFSSNVTSCCKPLTVRFYDQSHPGDNLLVSWSWDFGDGGTGTGHKPSHTYDTPGTYNVTLTVTDSHGCSDNVTKTEYITVNEVPTADFSSNVTSCCEPLTVQFTDNSTAGSNPIVSWSWDFGDGYTSTAQNASHTYDTPGTYTVSLTVTDSHGCSDTETKTEYITANEGPTAAFSANVTRCSLTVEFTDESTAGSNPIVSWSWDFGDGQTSTAQNSSHTYDAAGTYNVTLTVTDSHGCSDAKTEDVTLYAKPTATASSNSPVPEGATIELYGGPDGMASYYWTGPYGWNSTDQNPTRPDATTAMAGTYTLTVTSEYGCTDDATTDVLVIVPRPPRRGGGGCPEIKELTCDWDGHNTTETLYNNDRLTADLLGPSPDGMHSLLLEKWTHAPTVAIGDPTIGERTYYVIVIRELEETPPLPENTIAIVAFNVTPEGAVFDRDIFLTLGLDQVQLPENALEGTLTIAYYDDVNGVWVPLESEPGEPDGVAELTLSTAINHFTIFAVLVEVAPAPPPPPAHFVASGLGIEPSVERIWKPVTFVTKTGESVTITANIANDGGQEGTYIVELKLNGETVDTTMVTLGAGQSQQVSFTVSGLDYGQYEVEVAGLSDDFTTSRTITWWLIIVIIAAIGLIIWGVVWRRRRRRAALEG